MGLVPSGTCGNGVLCLTVAGYAGMRVWLRGVLHKSRQAVSCVSAVSPHALCPACPAAQIRIELAEKELALLEKEKALLTKEQTLAVLAEEVRGLGGARPGWGAWDGGHGWRGETAGASWESVDKNRKRGLRLRTRGLRSIKWHSRFAPVLSLVPTHQPRITHARADQGVPESLRSWGAAHKREFGNARTGVRLYT